MPRRCALLIVLFVAGTALSGDPAPAPIASGRIPRAPEFVAKVNAAIDRGVALLCKAQAADGSWTDFPTFPGATTALVYHTLRVCGVPRDDPAAKRAWDALVRGYRREDLQTYSAATYLMAIAEHGDRVPGAQDDRDVKLSAPDLRWAQDVVGCIVGGQDDKGRWGYAVATGGGYAAATPMRDDYYDHSNLQYALLGLKCGARCGVAIEPGVWARSLTHLLAVQEQSGPEVKRRDPAPPPARGGRKPRPDDQGGTRAIVADHARGWDYVAFGQRGGTGIPYASMTAGGVSSVVICRSELLGTRAMTAQLDADSERSVWDGLAWLGSQWKPTQGRDLPAVDLPPELKKLGVTMGKSTLDLYEYYAVERAGILAGVEWMADLDWYGAGAEALLASQAADGSWSGVRRGLFIPGSADAIARSRELTDTCFALLFLKRGTTPVRRGAVTQAGDDSDIDFAAARNLTGTDFGDFLDLVLLRWRRATDDSVKVRLFEGATTVGPKLVEPLLVRMDSSDAEDRIAAHALLKFATGMDHGFDPAATREKREDAVVAWQGWWLSAKDRLFYDPATKRLASTK